MRALRLILLALVFALADAAIPAVPDALEACDEVDDVGHPVTRRDTQEQPLARLPVPARCAPVSVTTLRPLVRRVAPARRVATRPLRKIPLVVEPASAPEEQS